MAKKTKGKLSSSEKSFLESPDLESKVNGLSVVDAAPEPFSFTCHKRVYNDYSDGYNYFVEPDGEYGDLDFEGHDVVINGVTRKCNSFGVTEDGHIVIFVTSLSEL